MDSGAGLEAQRQAIRAECQRRRWDLFEIYEDAASGRVLAGHAGLKAALTTLEGRCAAALVVAKLRSSFPLVARLCGADEAGATFGLGAGSTRSRGATCLCS